MGRKQQDDISIDDFHPRKDGFVQTYTGEWREQGMIATAWLAPVERDHFPRGLFLRDAYELSSTYERSTGGEARGAHQEDLGAELARKLRERMKTEMRAAGWQVVAQTREGQDIWQYKQAPSRVFPGTTPVTSTQITVIRTVRNVSFTCQVCGKETTQLRMPGPRPRYCSESCKAEGERAKTRARVGRLRESQKKNIE